MSLTLSDPLANQDVLITLTLPKSDTPRDERALLVALGIAGKTPIIQAGRYANIPDLIEQAWTAFGVAHSQTNTAAAETIVATEEPETLQPGPRAVNLSLF